MRTQQKLLFSVLSLCINFAHFSHATDTVAPHKNQLEVDYASQQATPLIQKMDRNSKSVASGITYADGMNILCIAFENLTQYAIKLVSSEEEEQNKIAELERLYGIYQVLKADYMTAGSFTTKELKEGRFTRHNYNFFAKVFEK